MFAHAASLSPTTFFAISAAASELGRVVRTSMASVIRCSSFQFSPACSSAHGEIDGEDAAFPGQVADVKGAAVGLDSLAADGQPEAQACAIGAPAVERAEKLLGEAAGQPAALVFDFDANPALGGNGPEADMAFAAAELERVAEEIGDGGRQEQTVGVDGNRARHRRDGEVNASRGCLEGGRVLHVPDELGQDDVRAVLRAGAEPDRSQGTIG